MCIYYSERRVTEWVNDHEDYISLPLSYKSLFSQWLPSVLCFAVENVFSSSSLFAHEKYLHKLVILQGLFALI